MPDSASFNAALLIAAVNSSSEPSLSGVDVSVLVVVVVAPTSTIPSSSFDAALAPSAYTSTIASSASGSASTRCCSEAIELRYESMVRIEVARDRCDVSESRRVSRWAWTCDWERKRPFGGRSPKSCGRHAVSPEQGANSDTCTHIFQLPSLGHGVERLQGPRPPTPTLPRASRSRIQILLLHHDQLLLLPPTLFLLLFLAPTKPQHAPQSTSRPSHTRRRSRSHSHSSSTRTIAQSHLGG